MLDLHDEIQFRDPERPQTDHIYLRQFPAPAIEAVSALLHSLPDPALSIHFLDRLVTEAPDAAARIASDRDALRYALTIFSYSRFLADAVIGRPEWLLEIAAARDLHRGFLGEQYEDLLVASLPSGSVPRPEDLALFRRKQLLRIVLRDVLGFADLSETAEDLSSLAGAILNVTWRALRRDLSGISGDEKFSIIALGKLGGRELNYSSDIDLMFICSSPRPQDFFCAAANRLTDILSAYTPAGICYRVDLRLRPDGRYGEICHSLEAAKNYYASRGRDWELQMLIKARVAAGDASPGRELLAFVEPLIYKTTTDFSAIEAVSEARARIHEKQRRGRQTGTDIKLARGGIRDIEFLVQCLQRLHGGKDSWVRHGGTLLGLSRLRDKELLSPAEYARLASAYQFLRNLEHRLQFDEDRQTHTLPGGADPETLRHRDLLARKMPVMIPAAPATATSLQRELDLNLASVQALYDRVIHSRPPAEPPAATPARAEFPSANLRRYLDQRAPRLSRLMASGVLVRSQKTFESFLEKAVAFPEWLDRLECAPDVALCTIDLFEHSRYFANQMVSHPSLLLQIRAACSPKQGRTGFEAPRDPPALRRFYREQMMRIQSDSVFHRVPVFKSLSRTSALAESVIGGAYEIAVAEARANAPPLRAGYGPSDQMMVIALGRLGMLEFDLASDADLVFVIPDSDAAEILFWTRVAERMIGVISAYTGDGLIFTIDTRLRPNGREGALVQTESAYKDYFENRAEAWEGISYMKARGVAGSSDRSVQFLGELQEIDWRRYGQSGRSRMELAGMRSRLEREQGKRNPLKAGAGGYYDIDFALMYLRLKSAGFFFKVLNTPARIETIEKMGHLSREDAEFLRTSATFYRAIDHGMRISTGHAEARLPTNPAQLTALTELVHRWTPAALHADSLEATLKQIRHQTRAFFERTFAQ